MLFRSKTVKPDRLLVPRTTIDLLWPGSATEHIRDPLCIHIFFQSQQLAILKLKQKMLEVVINLPRGMITNRFSLNSHPLTLCNH
jgi:hypothetical protein